MAVSLFVCLSVCLVLPACLPVQTVALVYALGAVVSPSSAGSVVSRLRLKPLSYF